MSCLLKSGVLCRSRQEKWAILLLFCCKFPSVSVCQNYQKYNAVSQNYYKNKNDAFFCPTVQCSARNIMAKFDGIRLNRGVEYRWGMKNRDFQPISRRKYHCSVVQGTYGGEAKLNVAAAADDDDYDEMTSLPFSDATNDVRRRRRDRLGDGLNSCDLIFDKFIVHRTACVVRLAHSDSLRQTDAQSRHSISSIKSPIPAKCS